MIDFTALVDDPILDQFGEAVTFQRVRSAAGATAAGRGIFDDAHRIILDEVAGSEANAPGHSTTTPMLSINVRDLGFTPRQGDQVTVRGQRYQIWDVQPEGDDWVDLPLRRVL